MQATKIQHALGQTSTDNGKEEITMKNAINYDTLFTMANDELIALVTVDEDAAMLVADADTEFHPKVVDAAWDHLDVYYNAMAWVAMECRIG